MPTTKEVNEVMDRLQKAMLESIEASKAEENSKLRRIKAHYELTLAKEELRALSFNN